MLCSVVVRRLASIFRILALVVTALGLVGFYRGAHPVGRAAWIAELRQQLGEAVAHPVVWSAAAVAIATAMIARYLDRRPPLPVIRPRSYEVGPSVAWTATGGPRDRDRLRWRLEGLLESAGDVVTFVDELIAGAVRARASDIHIQPLDERTQVSYRIDGVLGDVVMVARSFHNPVVRRVKILSRLVVYRSDEPQDGHFTLESPLGSADIRVSVVPTHHGEKVVMRLALARATLLDFGALGMPERLRSAYEKLLQEPQGLIVLTGPTGSGKTTTIYSSLAHIRKSRGGTANIATLEDPIEVDLPFLNQTQIDRLKGLSFAAGLRALLRQDPNVMMVGEIRDPETAEIAVQAGLTGHLILTTLHADSSSGVFTRLIDAGVEPFLVASSSLAFLSQRLVRRLCPECRRPDRPSRAVLRDLLRRGVPVTDATFYRGEGCSQCDHSGLQGRLAVFELLAVTPELRRLVTAKVPTDQLERSAVEAGMRPLLHAAVAAAAAGHVSLEEALRVVG